ncbi:MAG: hypothetical protein GWP08_08315 [Nitrospiraceae bacterium]|nr:hypothetical protein [Nitrospiraceae bacterium]
MVKMRRYGVTALVGLMLAAGVAAAEPIPLVRAHAHNDYRHKRPLLDALSHGFCSVEADVHLVDGALLVAHDLENVRPERTLQALYLDPLRARVKANGGSVYPGGPQFSLLVDIKSRPTTTYAALHEVFAEYAELFTKVEGDTVTPGPVLALISGNRPVRQIAKQPLRYAAIDGRLDDLDSDAPAHLIPWISSSWASFSDWNAVGDLSEADRKRLDEVVRKTHAAGRRLRFWGMPNPASWPVLYEAGVDLINTDNLARLEKFLLEQKRAEEGKN